MSTNINDTAAIQALLDQLKSSDAWQKVAGPNVPPVATSDGRTINESSTDANAPANTNVAIFPDPYHELRNDAHAPASPTSKGTPLNATSVASLLSQLQSSIALNAAATQDRAPRHTSPPTTAQPGFVSPPPSSSSTAGPEPTISNDTLPRAPYMPSENLRACTFQQALPHLARLSEDRDFLKTLAAMKTEQTELERQVWRERRDIQRKHEERVKAARTKAGIIGAGLTQYEADAMTDSFRAELLKFDRDRVLPAWDGLVTKQQAALEALGVPAMFPTTETSDRERQQKIMQVLGGLVGNEADSPTRASGGFDR